MLLWDSLGFPTCGSQSSCLHFVNTTWGVLRVFATKEGPLRKLRLAVGSGHFTEIACLVHEQKHQVLSSYRVRGLELTCFLPRQVSGVPPPRQPVQRSTCTWLLQGPQGLFPHTGLLEPCDEPCFILDCSAAWCNRFTSLLQHHLYTISYSKELPK